MLYVHCAIDLVYPSCAVSFTSSVVNWSLWFCVRPAQRMGLSTVWMHAQINLFSHWGLMMKKCQVGRSVCVWVWVCVSDQRRRIVHRQKKKKIYFVSFIHTAHLALPPLPLHCVVRLLFMSHIGMMKAWVSVVVTYKRNVGNLTFQHFDGPSE